MARIFYRSPSNHRGAGCAGGVTEWPVLWQVHTAFGRLFRWFQFSLPTRSGMRQPQSFGNGGTRGLTNCIARQAQKSGHFLVQFLEIIFCPSYSSGAIQVQFRYSSDTPFRYKSLPGPVICYSTQPLSITERKCFQKSNFFVSHTREPFCSRITIEIVNSDSALLELSSGIFGSAFLAVHFCL